ncbi:MAG: 50S ribosomal protein L14e [Candidatus Parvarchaeota archaeon]|nr:50S ribosomal protein L14e [Candidatus Jingweiarchaeum tengchongense]MCW1297779.1 50S ribosomal protein L14e [Candidatus Jingweiarchaeum tengchongense]MCW1299789.1 50S ribosomal protein L14e [Candidatus Jingweiarchaeum tengchongense]MCW1304240.1 50S ribosomal protein L14e [Candidatus Jingweiarchaeum tengchongense]MCW1305268.1 50S ribosomal protein L14e [Candidatus Jingweiarchaeum tengchongense]
MIEIGRACIKTKGREKNRKCVIVDVIDNNFVLIDGEVKRRRCNIDHLKILPQKIEIEKGASTEEVINKMKEANLIPKEFEKRQVVKEEKKEKAEEKKKVEEKKGKKEAKKKLK